MKKLGKKTTHQHETVEAYACLCSPCQCNSCGPCGIYSSATMARYDSKSSRDGGGSSARKK
ncbi:CLI_3235 family bacteriocin precursor [Desulfovibrio sp. QI0430]